ncbi:MAG: transporter substrate-binding domain-containing protein, partial [Desulfobulbaceae bacterium]|nr:transporter substrate-binding domain-containing protein [Desulfobulbaceae bacterium]
VSIFISGLSADLVSAQSSAPEPMVTLTPEEQAWLAEHPEIALGASTDYPPMVIKRYDGTHIGVLVDYFELVSRRLNTRIRLQIEDSWADIQEKAQNREIDGLAFGGRDPSRDALYNATDIMIPTYFSVFARSQNEYRLKSFSDLKGMRIGYKRAARPTKTLLEKLPSSILKPYDDHESMTQALLSKEIDVIVAWMSYDHWRKEKLQGTIDNILLIDEYPIEMVTYIRKDWPELIPILNKAIAVLQQEALPRINNKWFGQWPQRSAATSVPLTSEERAWLDKKHTVRVRIADWPPYLIVNGDKPPQGIVIEYLKLIGERTGITFKNEVTGQPFAEFLDNMKQRQGPDMTAVIVPTPEREQYLSFSETYLASPQVIFIREQDKPILDISGLTGKTLAVPRGFVVHKQLARDYPEIRLALFDSDEEALQAVATGRVDAYIGNLTVASHIIHRRGFSSLHVTAASPFKEQSLSMGNRKDWPELTSIINKAMASITEEEKTAIRSKYLAIKYEQGIDKAKLLQWILIIGGATLGIVLVVLFWNRRLFKETSRWKDAEERLHVTFDNMPIAAVMIDKDDSMYLHNRRFLELFGYTLEDIPTLAEWWLKAYPDEQYRKWVIETWNDCLRRSIEEVTNIEAKEYKVTCKNGDVRDMEISGHFLGDRYLATHIDNTERNRAKDQLLKAKEAAEDANRAKSTFLANMSHELRTPLNTILGFGQVMGRDPGLPEKYKQNIEIMSHSGEHLLSLIDEILELSKIESGRVTLNKSGFNLHRMVETTQEMFRLHAEKKGLSLKVERGDGLPEHINADERKLNQILSNLLSNAIKYTNTGGVSLRVSCRISALDRQSATESGVTSPAGDQSSRIEFKVADTGIGIAAEDLDKIFEPFSQISVGRKSAEGAGLGLALARQYVKAMGGTFSVKSLPGKGTTFTVELPYESALTSEIGIQPFVRQVVGLKTGQPRYRILIAEDNTGSRVMLKQILKQVGFQVREAENGQEAVALFKSWNPHLIWMDIRMPVMDGLEATKQIRELTTRNARSATRNPIIIGLTASVFEEDKDKVLAGGCDDFVRKPFQVDEIFGKMEQYLDVRYIYQDPQTPEEKPVTPALTSADLAGLPKDLVQQINTASKGAMSKKLLDLLHQIPPDYIHVTDAMVDLISQNQFSKIIALTEKENKDD